MEIIVGYGADFKYNYSYSSTMMVVEGILDKDSRRESNETIDTEIRMTQPQSKDTENSPEGQGNKEWIFSENFLLDPSPVVP